MEGELAEDMEVVMIITRGKEDSKKPGHQLSTFPRDVGPDFSKLYIYNAVWDTKTEGKGNHNSIARSPILHKEYIL